MMTTRFTSARAPAPSQTAKNQKKIRRAASSAALLAAAARSSSLNRSGIAIEVQQAKFAPALPGSRILRQAPQLIACLFDIRAGAVRADRRCEARNRSDLREYLRNQLCVRGLVDAACR